MSHRCKDCDDQGEPASDFGFLFGLVDFHQIVGQLGPEFKFDTATCRQNKSPPPKTRIHIFSCLVSQSCDRRVFPKRPASKEVGKAELSN